MAISPVLTNGSLIWNAKYTKVVDAVLITSENWLHTILIGY